MKSLFLILLLASHASAAVWKIDSSHSTAAFKVRHMKISSVPGKVTGITGTFDIDDKDFTKSKIDAKLDPNTISTGNEKRDGHLKSADFLDTANHKEISFKSKKIEKKGNKYTVTGDFTLHGVTKELKLNDAEISETIKDFQGERRAFNATAQFNRQDYGVKWSKTLDNGGLVADDIINVELAVEMTK